MRHQQCTRLYAYINFSPKSTYSEDLDMDLHLHFTHQPFILQKAAPDVMALRHEPGSQFEMKPVMTTACTTHQTIGQLLSQLPSVVSTTLRPDLPSCLPDTRQDLCETAPGDTSFALDHVKESLRCRAAAQGLCLLGSPFKHRAPPGDMS